MTPDTLQATLAAKKSILIGQRDQLNANLNATLGAIAIVEELLGEAVQEQQRAAEVVALEKAAALQDAADMERMKAVPEPMALAPVVDDAEVEAERLTQEADAHIAEHGEGSPPIASEFASGGYTDPTYPSTIVCSSPSKPLYFVGTDGATVDAPALAPEMLPVRYDAELDGFDGDDTRYDGPFGLGR